MFKHGIIFFGLMVTTSAAGFALSVSHDAYMQNNRLTAQNSVTLASVVHQPSFAAFTAMPQDRASDTTLHHISDTPDAADSTAVEMLTATSPQPVMPVLSSQQQQTLQPQAFQYPTAAPLEPTLRPRMRDDQQDTALPLPVINRPSAVLRADPAPFAMNLPVYSYSQGGADTSIATPQPRIAPSPRYLIGVYR